MKIKNGLILMLAMIMLVSLAAVADAAYYPKKVFARFSATCGGTITQGQMVAIADADGYAYAADANVSTLRPALGIAGMACVSGGKVEIVTMGIFSGWSSLAEGSPAYLSETAGAVTQSTPTYSQQVGYAISTTEYYINCINYFDTSSLTALGTLAGASPIVLEGATANDYETTIAVTDPTADRTATLPDATGTVALRTGETTTATDTLTAAECGKMIFLNSATEFATTLPALSTVATGCQFEFIVKAAASGANYTIVTGNSLENKIYGSMEVAGAVVPCADEDTITLVDGNAIGDWVKVRSDGANWYISGSTVTATKATCTAAD